MSCRARTRRSTWPLYCTSLRMELCTHRTWTQSRSIGTYKRFLRRAQSVPAVPLASCSTLTGLGPILSLGSPGGHGQGDDSNLHGKPSTGSAHLCRCTSDRRRLTTVCPPWTRRNSTPATCPRSQQPPSARETACSRAFDTVSIRPCRPSRGTSSGLSNCTRTRSSSCSLTRWTN